MSALSRRLQGRGHAGFTLVEMLVAMLMLSAIGALFMTIVLGSDRSAKATKQQHDVNEEARLAINRMAREIRQATAITGVRNPDGAAYSPTAVTAITFSADFDGDTCINGTPPVGVTPVPTCLAASTSNPEILTYCFDPSDDELLLFAGSLTSAGCPSGSQPILASGVTQLTLKFRSNLYLYDANVDGITTWTELDDYGPPVGNDNDLLDSGELGDVDSVSIELDMLRGTHAQEYRTQISLRNNS